MGSDLKDKKILFVEDSTLVRFFGCRILEEQGYLVEESASAEEAFRKVKKTSKPFDLIIIDIHLPDMDGLDLLKEFKSMPAYTYQPVMILSADKRISLVKRAVALGAVDYFCKPFSGPELIKRVEKIIGPAMYGSGFGTAFLKKVIANEINRAQRGKLIFSLVFAKQIELENAGKQSIGDLVKRIQDCLRGIDLVVSLNNRTIAVVLPITGVEGAAVVIGKISACLPGKWHYSIASYPEHGKDLDALLGFAEEGLVNNLPNERQRVGY